MTTSAGWWGLGAALAQRLALGGPLVRTGPTALGHHPGSEVSLPTAFLPSSSSSRATLLGRWLLRTCHVPRGREDPRRVQAFRASEAGVSETCRLSRDSRH